MSANKSIIIKKVIKKSGGGHHGGAWKVAYADFVTAMMAFFLLMWLLNMSSDEKRIRLSAYFKHFSIYTEGGTSFMKGSSEIFNESGESADKVFKNPKGAKDGFTVQQARGRIETGIAGELGGGASNVSVGTTTEGIRIQLVDKAGSEMFESGNNKLTPEGAKILKVVGNNIKDLPNKVSIEGHTDSTPVEKKGYGNWELSADRALIARRELEKSGLVSARVKRVSGFADTEPMIKDDPSDPSNRRISIILHMLPESLANEIEDPMPPKYSLDNPAGNNIKLSTLVGREEASEPPAQVIKEQQDNTHNNSKSQPVVDENWIPVIDESDNQPVLDRGWSPVIEDESKEVLEEAPEPITKNNGQEAEIIVEDSGPVEKLPYMKLYGAEQRSKKPRIVQELNSPVMPGGSLLGN